MLEDEGVAELLPLLAGPAFGNLKNLSICTTRLTEASATAFVDFLSVQFPEGRRLVLEMKVLNIRNIFMKSLQANPMEQFKK